MSAALGSVAAQTQVADTQFDHDRGFYDAPFSVAITTETAGATIRYTTDGSLPTETHGTVYSAPIPINGTTVLRAMAYKSGMLPTDVDTHTYLFIEEVLQQPYSIPGWPEQLLFPGDRRQRYPRLRDGPGHRERPRLHQRHPARPARDPHHLRRDAHQRFLGGERRERGTAGSAEILYPDGAKLSRSTAGWSGTATSG